MVNSRLVSFPIAPSLVMVGQSVEQQKKNEYLSSNLLLRTCVLNVMFD